MPTNQKIHDEFFKLRKQIRDERMKLMGVDMAKLRAFEKETVKKFNKLQKELKKMYKKAGEDVAERHRASHARARRIAQKDIEALLSVNRQHPEISSWRFMCPCYFPHTAEFEHSDHEVLLTPTYTTTSSGSVTFDTDTRIAHPIAIGNSEQDGDFSGAEVKTRFTFSFTPENDGTYCILPVVQLNGYWMLYLSYGCEDIDHLPVFELIARVRVRVEQLSALVQTHTHYVLDGPNYNTFSSGFDYDSEVNQELLMEVPLTGGDQTVVFVECILEVGTSHVGHSTIDLQSSPNFYVKVPMVRWGRPCHHILPIDFP